MECIMEILLVDVKQQNIVSLLAICFTMMNYERQAAAAPLWMVELSQTYAHLAKGIGPQMIIMIIVLVEELLQLLQ